MFFKCCINTTKYKKIRFVKGFLDKYVVLRVYLQHSYMNNNKGDKYE